jgi:uncharacterized protein
MVELDTVLLKVASRCNLDCSYCYVYHAGDLGWSRLPKTMTPETSERIAKALALVARDQARRFAVVLHGGEPLLLGLSALRHLFSSLREVLPDEYPISIQTNGILLTDEILDLCSDAKVDLSISIDGPRNIHDRNRVGRRGEGTFEKVIEGIRRLKAHPDAAFLFAGLLAVVDPTSDPEEVYAFFKTLEPPSVDFIYRDGNHSRLPHGKFSKHSTEYGRWMTRLLNVYVADEAPIRIRMLDDLIKLVLGGSCSKEGMGLTDFTILIIETDGSIAKNDTLKNSFDGADRFDQEWSIHTVELRNILDSREFALYHQQQRPGNSTCENCGDLRVCGGGMVLHRWRDETGYDNPSIYCEDQKLLIAEIRAKVAALERA